MALSEVFRLVVQSRVDDRICSFGLHYQCVSGLSTTDSARALVAAFIGNSGQKLMDCLASDVTFEGYYAHCLQVESALPHREPGGSQGGSRPGTSCPANMCSVVTLQTANLAAKRQGRIYVSGISKTDLTDGLWDATFVDNQLRTFAESLDDEITNSGQTFQPRIIQRIVNGNEQAPNPLEVSSTRVTRIPYTQRRRSSRQLGYAS